MGSILESVARNAPQLDLMAVNLDEEQMARPPLTLEQSTLGAVCKNQHACVLESEFSSSIPTLGNQRAGVLPLKRHGTKAIVSVNIFKSKNTILTAQRPH